ncbi:MAG: RNA polymerase-binding protein DksA [Pseudomonadota bacterium]
MSDILPVADGYRPSDDEPFMNSMQQAYFRQRLEEWKRDILDGARETIGNLRAESSNHPDLVDRASAESDKALELRTRDRQRKLISKIDAAIRRIDDGTYGFCDDTGEPIGLRRLEARPTATLSLEAQERHERKERIIRDD